MGGGQTENASTDDDYLIIFVHYDPKYVKEDDPVEGQPLYISQNEIWDELGVTRICHTVHTESLRDSGIPANRPHDKKPASGANTLGKYIHSSPRRLVSALSENLSDFPDSLFFFFWLLL